RGLFALTGDAIDNVPGVAKVGPKTAAKWLAQYGTLEEVIAHANEIGGVVGENLRAALAWLPDGRKLLTIRTDCSFPFQPQELLLRSADTDVLRRLYERFEFKPWLRELEATPPTGNAAAQTAGAATESSTRAPIERHYETVLDEATFERWT